MHHEIQSFFATAPGAAGAAAAAVTGDSLTMRNAIPGSSAKLIQLWAKQQVAGFTGILATSWNDTSRGIQAMNSINNPVPLLGYPSNQPVQAQELISATIAGSAVAGDQEFGTMLLWYENVPGLSGRYIDSAQLETLAIRAVTVRLSITAVATGTYSGAVALNSSTDLLRPNTDYALIGADCNVTCAAIGIRAPDWSNVRVGIPGNGTKMELTGSWFQALSDRLKMPFIPVFNNGNKAAILIDVLQDENATAVPLSLNVVELQTTGINTR